MKNRYQINEEKNSAKVFVKCNGKEIFFTVSLRGLAIIQSYIGTWYGKFDYKSRRKNIYIMMNVKDEDGTYSTIQLHRILTSCPDGMVVDHINSIGLDNVDENLRVVTQSENIKSRKLGITGFTWNEDEWKFEPVYKEVAAWYSNTYKVTANAVAF